MTKQTKGLLALAVVGVAAYFILRQKNKANYCGSCKANATGTGRGVNNKYQFTQDFMTYYQQSCFVSSRQRTYKFKTGDIIIATAYSCWNGNAISDTGTIHSYVAGFGDVIIEPSYVRQVY